MLFHSLTFAGFLAGFLLGLSLFRGRARIGYTVVASYVFYSWWYPPYLPLLVAMTLIAYTGGMLLEGRGRGHLAVAIAVVVVPLAVVKYAGFVLRNVAALTGLDLPSVPAWPLPLGLSFITFTVIAYLVEVQRGAFRPERRLDYAALYISFFPHLIAGPILRPRELLPKLDAIGLGRGRVLFALALFSLGMIKKVLFADQIAATVDPLYRGGAEMHLGEALVALYGFTAQIYCDFSGYTDMAIAVAALVGVRFPRNFERPYLATSVREFWRRWHVSLSRWLRDYLYKPLGGSRKGRPRMVAAVLVTMGLGGLWHGANWTFLLWGLLHGGVVAVEHMAQTFRLPRPPAWLARLATFHVVAFSWVLFRAPDLHGVGRVMSGLIRPGGLDAVAVTIWPCLLTALVFLFHKWDSVAAIRLMVRRLPPSVTVPACVAGVATAVLLALDNQNSFIYFDF